MKNLTDTLLNYAGQTSTWRGLIFVAGSLGLTLDPELQNHIVAVAFGLVGIINIVRKGK